MQIKKKDQEQKMILEIIKKKKEREMMDLEKILKERDEEIEELKREIRILKASCNKWYQIYKDFRKRLMARD